MVLRKMKQMYFTAFFTGKQGFTITTSDSYYDKQKNCFEIIKRDMTLPCYNGYNIGIEDAARKGAAYET